MSGRVGGWSLTRAVLVVTMVGDQPRPGRSHRRRGIWAGGGRRLHRASVLRPDVAFVDDSGDLRGHACRTSSNPAGLQARDGLWFDVYERFANPNQEA
jgi:hypothetical protein